MKHPLFWPMLYVAAVVAVNVGFTYLPIFHTPLGTFAPMALVVGGIFVLRDYAQRAVGHGVLIAMAVGTLLSYFMAAPYVAIASALAFAVSEGVDWIIYTRRRDLPFSQRVLLSSAISTPVDSLVFLLGINSFSFGTLLLMIASKMLVALWIYRQESRAETSKRTSDRIDRALSAHWRH